MKFFVLWLSDISRREMEMCLGLHPTGLRAYRDIISFALTFGAEDSLFFIGLASIRKIGAEALSLLGFAGTIRLVAFYGSMKTADVIR
jgi:hypothetical protein